MQKKSTTSKPQLGCPPAFPSVPRGTPARAGFRTSLARVSLLAAASLIAACHDTRVTVHDLEEQQDRIRNADPVPVAPENLALVEAQPYRVAPGDVLNVALTGLPGVASGGAAGGAAGGGMPPLHMRVRDDGALTLPMVGSLHVAGLTLAKVEDAITAAYVPDYVKTLSVFVELAGTDEPTTVVVRGAAGAPGLVSLKGNQRNIMYALSAAGGFGSTASGVVRVRPVRGDQPEAVYNLADANDLRRVLQHPPLESGDMLVVEPQPISAIFVTGLVNSPGPIAVPPGSDLSVVRAIACSGGLRDFLEPKEATLWRRLPDGSDVRVKLNIADMLAGQAPDIALCAGDVLDIPHTVDTRVRQWAMTNIQIGPFGVGAFYDPITVSTFKNSNNSNHVGWGQVARDAFIYNATGAVFGNNVVAAPGLK